MNNAILIEGVRQHVELYDLYHLKYMTIHTKRKFGKKSVKILNHQIILLNIINIT